MIFEEVVFGFKGRYISNRDKIRKPIKHFIGERPISFPGAILILSSGMEDI
jgi:hypothetical protein